MRLSALESCPRPTGALLSIPTHDTMRSEPTFVFADLAGFTALTETHGDDTAADVAGEFCEQVRQLLPRYGAEAVKTIGDAIMVRCEDAGEAVALALEIVHEVGERHGFPVVRVGMHSGPAVERGGDWFGATVNLAARLSGLARGGEVLITEATRDAAGSLAGIELRERGRHRFKNVGDEVPVYAAQRSSPDEALPIDPVCRMAVHPDRCAGRLQHEGLEYSFCSLVCAERFAADPERFTAPG